LSRFLDANRTPLRSKTLYPLKRLDNALFHVGASMSARRAAVAIECAPSLRELFDQKCGSALCCWNF